MNLGPWGSGTEGKYGQKYIFLSKSDVLKRLRRVTRNPQEIKILLLFWPLNQTLSSHFLVTFGTLLGHFWNTFATVLGQSWNTFGTLSGHFLVTFGSLPGHFSITFWSLPGHFLSTFWSLSGHFRVTGRVFCWDNLEIYPQHSPVH